MNNKIMKTALLILVIICLVSLGVEAQCPMCKMSAETNLKSGGTTAAGLNQGIIYLLIAPYILMSIVGFLWWRNKRLVDNQELKEELFLLLEPHSSERNIIS